jgi:regulator of protease activity HflC (stomatin/prohibitin superfamily)
MDSNKFANPTRENTLESAASGWLGVVVVFALFGAAAVLILRFPPLGAIAGVLLVMLGAFLAKGLMTLQPNEAAVLVRRDGFFWVNPFYKRERITLRVRNFNTPTLKVNDKLGNPVEVAAVITWRVEDTAQAVFDVENYEQYINIQSEMALREVASMHAYDGDDRDTTLRGNIPRISELLAETVQRHVEIAGIVVMEAKITHLAYAQERSAWSGSHSSA